MKKDRRGDIGCYVYRHIRHDKNEVFYIGIGSGYSYQRAFQKCKRSKFWNNIVAITDYSIEIIMDRLTRQEAEEKEKEFIKLYGLKHDGGTLCNLTHGGDGSFGLKGELSPNFGKKYSKERVENMRQSIINKYASSPEVRQKISIATKGRVPHNKGKKMSDEQRRKLSIARKRLFHRSIIE